MVTLHIEIKIRTSGFGTTQSRLRMDFATNASFKSYGFFKESRMHALAWDTQCFSCEMRCFYSNTDVRLWCGWWDYVYSTLNTHSCCSCLHCWTSWECGWRSTGKAARTCCSITTAFLLSPVQPLLQKRTTNQRTIGSSRSTILRYWQSAGL